MSYLLEAVVVGLAVWIGFCLVGSRMLQGVRKLTGDPVKAIDLEHRPLS